MKNRIEVFFYKPYLEDLWFRQSMMADPETMEYNRVWGGTIPFPCEKWAEWYNNWVQNPNKRFYRYIATGKSRSFVGEAAYHYDPDEGLYLADVIIAAQSRRQGFGKASLQLLWGSRYTITGCARPGNLLRTAWKSGRARRNKTHAPLHG